MSGKLDAATAVVSISIFGVQAALAPADVEAWGDTILQTAPAILILFLIWRIWKLDKQHADCTANQAKTFEQLSLAYDALLDETKRCNLPTKEEFLRGDFTTK